MTIQNINVSRKATHHVHALLRGVKTPGLPDAGARPVLRWRIDPESGKLECRWTLRVSALG